MIDALLPPVHPSYIAIVAGNIKTTPPDVDDLSHRSSASARYGRICPPKKHALNRYSVQAHEHRCQD